MKSAYKGYEAYSYLEKGKDISSIEMCKGDKRVKEYLIELDDIPFEKGKYYYFNDIDNSFNIPPMEEGN